MPVMRKRSVCTTYSGGAAQATSSSPVTLVASLLLDCSVAPGDVTDPAHKAHNCLNNHNTSTATVQQSVRASLACLARMVTLRATSMPARSSRGSGSVKPCALAWDTTSEKGLPATKLLKM